MTTETKHLDRSDAFILTCESWMAQNCYIVLPVNPQSLSFELGARTSNELTRAAQLIHVWRFLGTGSTLTKPIIKITTSSGYIVPSFDPKLILECRELVAERTATARSDRSGTAIDPDAPGDAQASQYEQNESDIAVARAMYDEKLLRYGARIPAPEDTRDYISGGVYKQVGLSLKPNAGLTDSGLQGTGNLPDLYSQENAHVPIGIQNLYALFSLADERRVRKTTENSNSGQTDNRLMLVMSTMTFPRLVLWGWMGESGIAYTESAEDPNSFDVSFDFIVTETNPGLTYGNWDALVQSYRTNINATNTTLEHAQHQWPSGTPAQTPQSQQTQRR